MKKIKFIRVTVSKKTRPLSKKNTKLSSNHVIELTIYGLEPTLLFLKKLSKIIKKIYYFCE